MMSRRCRRATAGWRGATAALLVAVLLAAACAQDTLPVADDAGCGAAATPCTRLHQPASGADERKRIALAPPPPRSARTQLPAGPDDLVAPARVERTPGGAHMPSLSSLMGPFAERAAALQADAAAAATAAAAHLKAKAKDARAVTQRGPRRALRQTDTETVLIALIILIVDFFIGAALDSTSSLRAAVLAPSGSALMRAPHLLFQASTRAT
jgi:hypothetical protein